MISDDLLDDRVQELFAETVRAYGDSATAQEWLYEHKARLDGPLRLAVTGPPGAGKSTLVGALVGEGVAPVESDRGTGHLCWYVDGPQPRAQVTPWYGAPYEVPVHRTERGLRLAAALAPYTGPDGEPDPIHQVHIEWPSRWLRHTSLLDTPGLPPAGSGWAAAAAIWQDSDAVLVLSRTLAAADLQRVPPARGGWAAATLPLRTLVVLARADETSGGRVDGLLAAKQIARRRRREPDLTVLAQDAVAVSGLLGYAARTLRQDEYDAVALLATRSRTDLEPHLLSVDRFRAAADLPLTGPWRERLLSRLGLPGVRLATTLVRTGAHDPGALADALLRHSGLAELQATMADLFSARRTVLKARTALSAIEQLAHREPRPQSAYLLSQVERVVSEAHEFRELRLLAALRTRRAGLSTELAVEARRLAGGAGATPPERLGLPAETPAAALRAEAEAAAERWRREAQEPGRGARERHAAEVIVRSCEAMLHQIR